MKPTEPVQLVIVGISGDLAQRYLLPALYHLEQDQLLPAELTIVGTSRHELSTDDLRAKLVDFIRSCGDNCDETSLDSFFGRLSLHKLDPVSTDSLNDLSTKLTDLEARASRCLRRLFYLAIPPAVLPDVIDALGKTSVLTCGHQQPGRILIEKPFGRDLASAQALADQLRRYFSEEQIYRIDHFLAKETAQNIMYFRTHNPLVRDIWDSQYIDHIQITVAEDIDIEGRVDFYEQTGALRDVLQNHALQLLALTTMAEPTELKTEVVRAARAEVLSALQPADPDKAVRGQYEGYRNEVNKSDSPVETYVAVTAEIDNESWRGVPIYIRHGKALAKKLTDITVVFTEKSPEAHYNLLTIRLQPNEGIALKLVAKKPGISNNSQEIVMDYCYDERVEGIKHDAYEKLLIDAINGEQMFFPTAEEILASWHFVQPLLDEWGREGDGLESYIKGSWGPTGASQLLADEELGDWIAQDLNVCIPRNLPPTV